MTRELDPPDGEHCHLRRHDRPHDHRPRGEPPLGRTATAAGSRPLLAAALRAARAGWAVFPARPRGKTPAVRDWENAATTDPDRITAWWSVGWNVAVAAGRSGLLVLDLDTHTTPDPATTASATTSAGPGGSRAVRDSCTAVDIGQVDHPHGERAGLGGSDTGMAGGCARDVTAGAAADGWEVLSRLAVEAGEVPPWDTFTVATPSGGRHLYFRQPAGSGLRNTQGALGPWIDTRGHGGYVLAAGSQGPGGPGGRGYRVVRDVPVAALPAWLHHALTAPYPLTAATAPAGPEIGQAAADVVVSPVRVAAYLRAVVDGEVHAVAAAPVGTRHTTLLRAARRLGQWIGGGALTMADARVALTAAAGGYLGVGGYTARQVERDITDGLRYGAARPRHVEDLPDRPHPLAPAHE